MENSGIFFCRKIHDNSDQDISYTKGNVNTTLIVSLYLSIPVNLSIFQYICKIVKKMIIELFQRGKSYTKLLINEKESS